MGFFTSNKQENQPAPKITSPKIGLLIGVAGGAVMMMILGGLGYTKAADVALLMGLSLGVGGGYLYDAIQAKKHAKDPNPPADEESLR